MAEVTGLRNNCLPYPVYGCPWGVVFPILDNTGALVTGAAGLDSEKSLNGDTFTDCTNEATEIATASGMYYLLLTATEMSTDLISVIVKTSTTDAKTTPMVFNPRKLVTVRSGTAQGGSGTTIVLDAGASDVDDFYNGMVVRGFIDAAFESRFIIDYTGSSRTATVVSNWNTDPDSNDTFDVFLPEGVQIQQANTTVLDGVNGAGDAAADALLGRNIAGGSSTGRKVSEALAALRNRWANAAGTYTVYEEDDTTPLWTAALTSDAAAEPVTQADPS